VDGTRKVASLELDFRLPTDRSDELGDLAGAFNEMTARLESAQAEIRDFAGSLERKVELKTAELQTAQLQTMRAETMAALGRMAMGAAHEINNPLSGIIAFAATLRDKLPQGGVKEGDFETIIQEADRCARIVKGLLDFARGSELVRRPAGVGAVLDRALCLAQQQLDFRAVEVVRDYAPNLPDLLLDADGMERAFTNLLLNAAMAMEGTGRLTLTTSLEHGDPEEGDQVRVDVEDTGPGVPGAIQGKIFDPFFTTRQPARARAWVSRSRTGWWRPTAAGSA